MKKGGHTKNHSGFTIVETLIVLAVTGGLFLVAALYIGGKQAKTEFQVGVRDVQTRLQQVVNETASGYYPSTPTFNCSVPNNTNLNLHLTNGSGGQGEHDECIFIGKVVVFNKDKLYVFSLAGARQKDNEDVKNMFDARATVIAKSSSNGSIANAPDVYALPNGFELKRASQNGASPGLTDVYGVAILSSLADFGDSAGSQQFRLGALSGPYDSGSPIEEKLASTIDFEYKKATPYNLLKQVNFCIHNGGDKSALIIVGGDGSLTVRTEIKNGLSCGV